MDFFDSIVIPLAKKLVSCGVLGETADELLENAVLNRDEWEVQGHDIMKIYLEHYQKSHTVHPKLSTSDLLEQDANVASEDEAPDGPLDSMDALPSSSACQQVETSAFSEAKLQGVVQPAIRLDGSEKSPPSQSPTNNPQESHVPAAEDEDAKQGSGPIPPLVPGTANSSVVGTLSCDGTSDGTGDPDVVFAILDNLDAPNDFDSYILITPKQKRQREAMNAKKDGTAPNERRRRLGFGGCCSGLAQRV